MSPHGVARRGTEERWHHISRLVIEDYGKYETRMLALRKRIIARFKPKLSDGKVLDRARQAARARAARARKAR